MSGGREAAQWRRGSCSPDEVTAGGLGVGWGGTSRKQAEAHTIVPGCQWNGRDIVCQGGEGMPTSEEGRRPYNNEDNEAGGAGRTSTENRHGWGSCAKGWGGRWGSPGERAGGASQKGVSDHQ